MSPYLLACPWIRSGQDGLSFFHFVFRSDSLGFSFRGGHSRQASRTDSIYTLRATVGPSGGGDGTYTSIIKEKLFFWNRCKQSSHNGGGKESVAATNGHTNGFIGAAAAALGDPATRGASGRTQVWPLI